jgi:hypothetical protein
MPHMPFIIAAYAVTLGGLAVMLILGWRRMRRAEAALETDGRDRPGGEG